jgi:2-polyprenyl-3-methyl-5-hydroxy-6-metoxy-1,4-benzoquinol methylase
MGAASTLAGIAQALMNRVSEKGHRTMKIQEKRQSADTDIEKVQSGNRQWWTDHTMSYDWKDKVEKERFSEAWFAEIDRRFEHGARLFAHDRTPFDRIIPFEQLRGRDVLEIGCGMGLHSELMSRAGANLTAIDISDTSIEATTRRMVLRQLKGRVERMDARKLEFADSAFDFVWSWGVIHHSAQTAIIIKEIHRVLRPGGQARIMVYNIDGMSAYTTIVRDYLLGFWRGRSLDDCLWARCDGYMARHYSKDVLGDVMRMFFSTVTAETFGQDADAIPLPRQIRHIVIKMMSAKELARRANARGLFLFMTATK